MPFIEIDKKYKCIVADPPWKYNNGYKSSPNRTATGMTGAATKYPVLDVEEIKQINVPDIVDQDGCVLFLWATMPFMPSALEVMSAWGFTYKVSLIWVKTQWLGMGKWFRTNTEICLVGKTGYVKPFYVQKDNVIYAHPTRHSRKPEEFWEKVEPAIYSGGLLPGIELFARESRHGFDAWGLDYNYIDEVGKNDEQRD